jgi:hypothetical protein
VASKKRSQSSIAARRSGSLGRPRRRDYSPGYACRSASDWREHSGRERLKIAHNDALLGVVHPIGVAPYSAIVDGRRATARARTLSQNDVRTRRPSRVMARVRRARSRRYGAFICSSLGEGQSLRSDLW